MTKIRGDRFEKEVYTQEMFYLFNDFNQYYIMFCPSFGYEELWAVSREYSLLI